MELYKTFIRNNRTVIIGHILVYAQGIILMPIVIKTAGLAVYGGYILIYTILNFIYGISSFGVGFRNTRFLPAAEEGEARGAIFYPQFWFHLSSIILLSLIFIVFYPLVNKLFLKDRLIFSAWFVLPFLFSIFLFSQAAGYFLSTHRVNYFNYATVASPYINIAVVTLFYLALRHLSVNILIFTQAVAYLLPAIPLTIMLVREIGLKFTLFDFKNLIDDIRSGFPLRINYIMDFLLGSSDRYLIAYFMAVAAVGYYSPGYAIGSLAIFFPRVAGVVLIPLLSKTIDNGREKEAHTMFNYTIKGFLLLAIPFITGTAVMSGSFLNLVANAEVAKKACMVTPVIATATLFFGLNIIICHMLLVRLKTFALLKMNTAAAAVNILLNLVFLHIFKDVLVAAFSTLIGYLVAFVIIRKEAMKVWPLRFESRTIIRSIAASLFMGVGLYLISSWLGGRAYRPEFMLIEVVIGIAIYGCCLFIMNTFSREELLYLRKAWS